MSSRTCQPDRSSTCFAAAEPAVAIRGVHLDLKGLAPNFDRLLCLLDHFAALRFNAVLIEWEDMFPWSFDTRLRSPRCYRQDQIELLAKRADLLGVELIPLVQSLGHLENVLKHEPYARMREVEHRADCLNPLAPGAGDLIGDMIDEVLNAMPATRRMHLGGDEAWVFASHPDTAAFAAEHGEAALFLHHLSPLLERVNRREVRPILWHDMMVDWADEDLQTIGHQADLMVWGYRGSPDDRLHHHRRETLDRIAAAGVPMWGSSAYKGADGPYRDLPDAEARLINHLGWAQAASEYDLIGVVATGWSRYAFSRVQIEPIDACLTELAMAGLLLHEGNWPNDGWERCAHLIDDLGETTRVNALRSVLRKLEETRHEAWRRARQLKEHLAGLATEPERGDGGMAAFLFQHFEPWVKSVEGLADELRPMLQPLVGDASADAYCRAWCAALRREADDLRHRITTETHIVPTAITSCVSPAAATAGE